MEHELKTLPEYFKATANGKKSFEVRKNDRNFQVGDVLVLRYYDSSKQKPYGSKAYFYVTYILPGGQFGIADDYVVMSIEPINLVIEGRQDCGE